MSDVTLSHINKVYGRLPVVHDINLEVADQEFVVLVGPSGCGKSTTLRMVAGLEEISSGELRIGSRVVTHLPPKDRDIAMVFQNYALYQHMSVYDNLAFGLRNRRVAEDDIKREVDRATEILGLGPLLARKPFQLSGGQQQRVALGRCIVRHPKVFLFDEPLSNLDAKLRAHMRIELKKLRERVSTTSIYVTHDQVEAMTLGDRVVVMKDGRIQQVGTPLEIYNRPRNLFVAGFMGSPAMNTLKVELSEEGDVVLARAPSFVVRLPEDKAATLRAHGARDAILGIRPENIHLGEGGTDRGTRFRSTIEVTEQLGAELLAGVRLGNSMAFVSRIAPDAALDVGEAAPFWIDPRAMHFFDTATEDAIR